MPSLVQIIICTVPSHHLNQWLIIINKASGNKFQWNRLIFIQENVFENTICKMAAILTPHSYQPRPNLIYSRLMVRQYFKHGRGSIPACINSCFPLIQDVHLNQEIIGESGIWQLFFVQYFAMIHSSNRQMYTFKAIWDATWWPLLGLLSWYPVM